MHTFQLYSILFMDLIWFDVVPAAKSKCCLFNGTSFLRAWKQLP